MRYDVLNFIKNLKFKGQEVNESFMVDWANKKVIVVHVISNSNIGGGTWSI
jgi:hypothetical protein